MHRGACQAEKERFIVSLLENKRLVITGINSPRSIAYGIAEACAREGAELILTYNNDRFKERVEGYAEALNARAVVQLDATSEESLAALAESVKTVWPEGFDGFLHSIAWAPRESIEGRFLDGFSKENFLQAMTVSAYSLPAMAKALEDQLRPGSALLCLSYLGSEWAVPNYNTMGVCKAALEAAARYLAADLGPKGVRVNSLSPGPIKTLAASGIKDFGKMMKSAQAMSMTRDLIGIKEVGNTAAFLLSNYSAGITGETIYIDNGIRFHPFPAGEEA